MSLKTSPYLLAILAFNIIPVIGVAYYNWSPFEMFWLFWMETLIISLFNAVRVLFSQGHQAGAVTGNNSIKLHFLPAFRYLLSRLFIFLFYALFIIVFIGFMSNKKEDPVHTVRTLAFQNLFFNMALLLSICSNAFYVIKNFFANGGYRYAQPSDYPGIFDGRQIVIHVAVVLGAVGSAFLFENSGNAQYSSIWIISIFCIAKCIFELFSLKAEERKNIAITTGL
jgi:hypothetical protein